MFVPLGLLFGKGQGYNTTNHYQPLFSAKDNCTYCVQNSEESVNYKLSYRTETIQSTNGLRQNFCGRKTSNNV